MNLSDEKRQFLDMQEHPENYSDEQLEAMMAELDKETDAEAAWLRLNEKVSPRLFTFRSSLYKFAAIFLAAAFLGVLSFAGYRAISGSSRTGRNIVETDTSTVETERFVYEIHDGDTIFRFENVRLDSILAVVGRHYERQVIWGDKAPAHLRLFITCHTSHTLREFVEVMNMFDGFHITQDLNILYVESDEKKEGKR